MNIETERKRKRGSHEAGEEEGDGAVEEKWEYSAPSIPTSYWMERGFDQHYINAMDFFLRTIEEETLRLRRGTKGKYLIIWPGVWGNEETPILQYDDLLLPHWIEFTNALQNYAEDDNFDMKGSSMFSIRNMQLPSALCDLIIQSFKGKTMYDTFEILNNDFGGGSRGVAFATEIIQGNDNLSNFEWESTQLDNMDDINHLLDVIIDHPRMDSTRLTRFASNINGHDVLCSFLSKILASGKAFDWLCFPCNNIQTGGSTEFSDLLARNPPVKDLVLGCNCLNDNDAIMISRALKHNTNLQKLDLTENDITSIGWKALHEAIYDPKSLNAVSDCNHSFSSTCIPFLSRENHSSAKINRRYKIYGLLSSRNREGSNVNHLNLEMGEDDSLALVPKVLESVRKYSEDASSIDVDPLSIYYELLRGWKMPALYEKYQTPSS